MGKRTDYRVPESFLREATERIVQALQPEKVILFGSHAYGQPGPDSDVDLLIIARARKRPAARIAGVSKLFWPPDYPMEFLVFTPAEVRRRLARADSFLRRVLEQGRVIYESAR